MKCRTPEIEELFIKENRLIEMVMKDKDGEDLDISALSQLSVTFSQFNEDVETIDIIPGADARASYEGALLTVELTKTISEKLKPGYLTVRISSNNPDDRFTDGGEHLDIACFTVFKMKE